MKKHFKLYITVWAILLAVFNVVVFAAGGFDNTAKFTVPFWIGYIFITLTFIGQLVCGFTTMKSDDIKKVFFNIPTIWISYIGLFVSIIVGSVCMLVSAIPYWVGIIICVIVLAINAMAVISTKTVADTVENIDIKIKKQTFFIKSLTVDADTLMAKAKTEEIKAECRKVYEAIRYSDPMSNEALSTIEEQIQIGFEKLSKSVADNVLEAVKTNADELLVLIGDRNSKCKLLK